MADKLVVMVTVGPDDPEKATIPFVMATAAQASDVEVLMGFQGSGAWLVMKGMAEKVEAHGFPPLADLMEAYVEAGGEMYVCGPCVKTRKIDAETEFVDGAKVVNAATFVEAVTAANATLVY